MWKQGTIGDALSMIQNGVNCIQDKSGKGQKITRIETIANANIDYGKTGFSSLDEKQKSKAELVEGDILFSHINSPIHVGKTAIYNAKEPLYHGINLLRLRTIEDVDSNYFNYFLKSLFWSGYWKRTAKQSVNQASVNQTDIKVVPFSYPPLAEQQRIVAKLDAAFAEIDKASQAYQQSLYSSVICHEELKRSRLEKTLHSAELAKLGDIAELKNGLNYNKSEKGNHTKILGVGDFKNRFSIDTEKLQTIETNAMVKDEYLLEQGDIIFVRSNGNKQLIGRSILIEKADEPTTFSGFCIRCRLKDESISSEFLCHFLKSSVIRNMLIEGGGGANISNLNQKMLSDINVPLISFSDQQAYISWAENIEQHFENHALTLKQRLQLYSTLKSAILTQELQPTESEAA